MIVITALMFVMIVNMVLALVMPDRMALLLIQDDRDPDGAISHRQSKHIKTIMESHNNISTHMYLEQPNQR